MLDLDSDLSNADWTKQSWDLPCETPEELADYLEMAGIDPALFAELPVMEAAPWLTNDDSDGSLTGDTITAGGPMPWHKAKEHSECGSSRPWAVVSSKDGKVMGCHASEEAANAQLAALYASEDSMTAAAFTAEDRRKMAEKGIALPDGSYPIPNVEYLEKAIASLGRASQNDEYDRVRRHIIKRARALNAVGKLPEDWGITAAGAFTSMQRKRFAKSGVAMEDGSFPVRNASDLHNAVMSIGRAKDPEAAKRHVIERAKALGLEEDLPEDWETGEKPDSDDITAAAWDESKHPRHERGAKGGGRFRPVTVRSIGGDMAEVVVDDQVLGEVDTSSQDAGDIQGQVVDVLVSQNVRADPDSITTESQKAAGMETPPEPPAYDEESGEMAPDDEMAEGEAPTRKPGQARSNEEAFAKAVPLATDEPTRPGQIVKPFDIDKERADIDRRVRAGELTSEEGQRLTEQAWAKHERNKKNLTASAAGMVPLAPPAEWFEDPNFSQLTPLEVTADGQVRGHLAGWDTCHIGDPRGPGVCVSPPSSKTDYGFFHLGQVLAADGRKVPVGQITLDTGHAPLGMNARTAAAHYDHTGTAVADVRAGEDRFGIWVAGALRPHVSAEKARSLTAAKLSGDWRGIQGNLEMVGVLAVNVPGFPVPRPEVRLVASGEPETRAALVAAGILETVDPIAPEARREALLARILGRDALLAAALPRVLRRPQSREALERARLTAAAWDESAHPRHPKGTKAKGGKFAPKHGGSDVPSVTQEERTVSDEEYDKQVDSTADSLMGIIDDHSAEHFNYEGDEPTDAETTDAYLAGFDSAVEDDAYSDALYEGAAAAGIDVSDEDAMFEDGSAFSKFEEDVTHRMGEKAPVFKEVFGESGDIEAPLGEEAIAEPTGEAPSLPDEAEDPLGYLEAQKASNSRYPSFEDVHGMKPAEYKSLAPEEQDLLKAKVRARKSGEGYAEAVKAWNDFVKSRKKGAK